MCGCPWPAIRLGRFYRARARMLRVSSLTMVDRLLDAAKRACHYEPMDTAEHINKQITEARRMQYVASQTRDAGAVMRLEDMLIDLYRRLDNLK